MQNGGYGRITLQPKNTTRETGQETFRRVMGNRVRRDFFMVNYYHINLYSVKKLHLTRWKCQVGFTVIIFLYYDLDKFGIMMNLLSLWTLYTVKSERAESISLHVILGSLFLVSGFLSIVKIIGLFFWFGSFKSLQLKHHGYGIILKT